jgi:tetratricopeptide (TPR) repeat protein
MANPTVFWPRDWFLALLLVLATLLAYQPAWKGRPIWDDDEHMTKPELHSSPALVHIWTKPGTTQQYYPLVHSVFWIEHKIWNDAVRPYHLVNILLHSFSALLLFGILRGLKVPGAWLAAAIFALHPVHVESVAWISELKNTLSGVFFLSSIIFYLHFDQKRNSLAYGAALLLFCLGLLSKTVIATLPAAILVILWWQRGKLSAKRDVVPLLPFFAVGITAGIFTAWMERKFIGAHGQAFDFSFIDRCLIAGRAFWFYLFKLFWPAKLTFIYPRWNISHAVWWQYLFPLAALSLVAALWLLRRQRRAPLAAVLLFAGILFPALGFFNVYPFVFSFVADHFQYLASIAVIVLVAAGITLLLDRWKDRHRVFARVVPVILAIALGVLTWQQSHLYADPVVLYQATLSDNPDCWMAHNNLGNVLLRHGEVNEAAAHYRKVLQLLPNDADAHNNLGNALVQQGAPAEAITHYRTALELRPNDADAENNLGSALVREGLIDSAIPHFQKALELRSGHAERHDAEIRYNLGNALLRNHQIDKAAVQYRKAVEILPDYAEAHTNLGIATQLQGRFAEAIAEYEKTLQIDPTSLPTRNNLAALLATCPDVSLRNGERAVQIAQQAVQLSGGRDPISFRSLAAAYAESGQFAEAVGASEKALQLAPAEDSDSWVGAVQQELESYRAHQRPPH